MDAIMAAVSRMMAPLRNRVLQIVGRAMLTAIDDGSSIQLVQVAATKDRAHGDVPHFHPYGFTSVPLPGAYVEMLYQGGDRGFGCAILISDPRYRPTGWLSGEVGLHDHLGKFIRLREDGTLEISAPKIVLNAGERIELNAGTPGQNDGEIRVWAGQSYRLDVAGYATQLEFVEATGHWLSRDWTIGAIFDAAVSNPIEPPKVSDP